MRRRKKARAEVALLVVGQTAGIGQDDERGQVVREASERVAHPGPGRGESRQEKAGVHEKARRPVDVRPRRHRHEKGHAVDVSGDSRQEVAHPAAAVAMLPQWKGGREDGPWSACRRFHTPATAGVEGPPVVAKEQRFVVEEIHLTGPAVHEQLDHPAGFGGVMKAAADITCGRLRAVRAAAGQELRHRRDAETGRHVEERTAAERRHGHAEDSRCRMLSRGT